jgi:hypothetical protein
LMIFERTGSGWESRDKFKSHFINSLQIPRLIGARYPIAWADQPPR